MILGAYRNSRQEVAKHRKNQMVRTTILIPAHNEEAVLEDTLSTLMASLRAQEKVVVVADNCTDSTATIARGFGCTVLERFDAENRGKGYALSHGLKHLELDPPDIVIVLDADCQVEPDAISVLANEVHSTGHPVQGAYLLRLPDGADPKFKISEFAIYIKNYIRPLGLSKIGGSVPITGSGFGAPFFLLKDVDLASGEIVEDMKLGNDLALMGFRTLFCRDARVNSELPIDNKVAQGQRKRWEHGHISILARYVPKLGLSGLLKASPSLLFTAIDLAILPLTFLVAANGLMITALLVVAVLTGYWLPFAYLLSVQGLILVGLAYANSSACPRLLRLSDLVHIVYFGASKVGVYASLVTGRRSGWVKTRRDSKDNDSE
ncbi:MAG TPA: glycosyltransferase family 2 protein [Marinagarivorans sp.]